MTVIAIIALLLLIATGSEAAAEDDASAADVRVFKLRCPSPDPVPVQFVLGEIPVDDCLPGGGVGFTLAAAANPGVIVGTATTDQGGEAVISGRPPGDYIILEADRGASFTFTLPAEGVLITVINPSPPAPETAPSVTLPDTGSGDSRGLDGALFGAAVWLLLALAALPIAWLYRRVT